MKLSTILDGINYEGYADDRVITGIFYDSRKIKKDYQFIAIKGFNVDGDNFICIEEIIDVVNQDYENIISINNSEECDPFNQFDIN